MRPSVKKIIGFSFVLGFSSVIFSGGGQVFYPFGFINPAKLSQVKNLKIGVSWYRYAAFVRNKFNGTVALPTPNSPFSGIARSYDVVNFPGGLLAYRINNWLVIGLRYSHPYNSTITFGRSGNIARFVNNQSVTRVNDISSEFALSLSKNLAWGLDWILCIFTCRPI